MKIKVILALFLTLNLSLAQPNSVSSSQDAALGQGGTFGTIGVNVNPNLTDEDQNTVNTFFHDGLANEILRTECEKEENQDACRDESAYAFNRSTDTSIEAVARMLSVFSLVSGQGGGLAGGSASSGQAGGSSKADACGYIPAGTEAAAQFYQQAQQQQITQDLVLPGSTGTTEDGSTSQTFVNNQRESVFALMRSHKAREDSAQIQFGGWGVTAGCYGLQLAGRGLQGSFSPWTIVKGAAAGGLAAFYKRRYDNQKGYQDTLRNLANRLPSLGDCNPVTERQCYCTHPTTANDPQYCLPQILAARANDNTTVVSCVNNLLEEDPECRCVQNDTCFDRTFRDLTVSGGFGTNSSAAQLLQSNSNVLRGNLAQGGQLATQAEGQLAVAQGNISRALAKAKDLKLTNRKLNNNEQEQSDFLQGLGVPKQIARHFAAQPLNSRTKDLAKKLKSQGFSSRRGSRNYASRKKKNGTNVLYFSGRGLKNRAQRSGRNQRGLKRLSKRKGRKQASSSILQFSTKATAQAQITRDSSKPLFEIISRRYQVSGRSRLNLVGRK